MVAQKLTVPQFHRGTKSRRVAGPRCTHTRVASTTKTPLTIHVAVPPMFSVHLPTFMPTRLVPSAIQMAVMAAASRYTRPPGSPTQADRHAHVEHGGARKPDGDAHPVDPGAQEAMPRAEIAARPQIEPARPGIFGHQRGHGHRQRHHEEHRGQQPQRDRTGAGMCRRRNPARAHDADDGEQREVAQAQLAPRSFASPCRFLPQLRRRCGVNPPPGTPACRPSHTRMKPSRPRCAPGTISTLWFMRTRSTEIVAGRSES